jgi:glycosyltransferase involved in cell wall biosynthesis
MERHTLQLASTLSERGHSVTLGVLGGNLLERFVQFADPRVQVTALDPGCDVDDAGLLRWLRLFRGMPADVAVLAKGWVFSGNASLDLAARLCFGRYLTVEHITPPPRPAWEQKWHLGGLVPGLGLWWVRHMGSIHSRVWFPHRMYTVSEAIRQHLIRDYAYPADRLVTVHNGIDSERYRPDEALRRATRSAWGVPEDALVFGSVGRLVNNHKGLDLAIDAFAALCKQYPQRALRYVLVGEGPDQQELEQQVAAHGIADRVLFAGHTDRPWEVYPALDAFLMPSRFEGLGLSLMEAMACGCCPIAAAVGGITEVLADGRYGWRLAPDDRDGLFRAMQEFVALDAERRLAMARDARERIVLCFRASVQFASLARLIESEAADSDLSGKRLGAWRAKRREGQVGPFRAPTEGASGWVGGGMDR